MNLTEEQIERIADRMRFLGFDVSELSNDQISYIADAVIDALEIEFDN